MANYSVFTGKINSSNLTEWEIRTNSNGEKRFYSLGTADSSVMQSYVDSQISAQASSYIPNANPPQGFFGVWGYKEGPNDPKPRVSTVKLDRVSHKTPSFEKRKARGDIVVNPMRDGYCTITETPYVVKESIGRYGQQARYPQSDPNHDTLKLGTRTCAIVGGRYISGSYFLQDSSRVSSTFGWMPFDKAYILSHLDKRGVDGALVTDTAAALNEATMDLLTTLAELPETVKMVQDTLRFAGNKLKGFKTAEKALKKKLLKEGIPRNELQGADALAKLWLQYRYGLMPIWYTLQDVKKALKDGFSAEFVKESNTKVVESEPHKGFRGDWSLVDSCWMKRRFDPTDKSAQFRRVFGVNPFTTAWELTTLSFVVDWFINVGDTISALTPIPSLEEKATFSWKNKIKGTITNPDFPQGSVDIDLSFYEITPIDYQDHVSLRFEPVLTAKRKLDSLALSWTFLRNRFRKFK